MSAEVQPRLTPEQYLKLDESALDTRHEFYDGRIYAMSGGTLNHAFITAELGGELMSALQDKQCRVVLNDLRIRVAPNGLHTYPDIAVIFGEPELASGGGETLLNPVLLAEVLSPSTEAYDRGFKAAQYRTIPSLREYLLVSQNEPRVEVMRRDDDTGWRILDFFGMDAVCHLPSVGCDIALAKIYRGITFNEPIGDPAHPSAVG